MNLTNKQIASAIAIDIMLESVRTYKYPNNSEDLSRDATYYIRHIKQQQGITREEAVELSKKTVLIEDEREFKRVKEKLINAWILANAQAKAFRGY